MVQLTRRVNTEQKARPFQGVGQPALLMSAYLLNQEGLDGVVERVLGVIEPRDHCGNIYVSSG